MTVLVDAATAAAVIDDRELVAALREAMLDEAEGLVQQPARLNLASEAGFFRIMPAVLPKRGIMGAKIFNGSAGRGVRYLIALYDADSGDLRALVDASLLTAARTGAAAAVAFDALAQPDATRVAVIGAGLEARASLRAFAAARQLTAARVFSPRPASRAAFAQEMTRTLGIDVRAANDPETAVAEADAVIVATNTGTADPQPAFLGSWIRPGQHISSIGSTGPRLRELDAACFAAADVLVLDAPRQAAGESGDLIAARDEGTYHPDDGVALADVLAGRAAGRTAARQVTLYKSVGTALQDLVAAHVAVRAATARQAARDIGDIVTPKAF